MSKSIRCCVITVICLLGVMGNAHAGAFETVRSWLTGEALALIISAAATVIAGVSGLLYRKVALAMREAGDFLHVLGAALEDNRVTREELAAIVREGRELFAVWR